MKKKAAAPSARGYCMYELCMNSYQVCVPAAQQPNCPNSCRLRMGGRYRGEENVPSSWCQFSTNQLTCFSFISHWSELVLVQRSPVLLDQLDLPGVGGEEEHDGEARQQAGVLDGEGEEEAAAAGVLFLATHLVHLWELEEHKNRERKNFLNFYITRESQKACIFLSILSFTLKDVRYDMI